MCCFACSLSVLAAICHIPSFVFVCVPDLCVGVHVCQCHDGCFIARMIGIGIWSVPEVEWGVCGCVGALHV